MQKLNLTDAACFGVAGNFTGHLEQAGEADSFKAVQVKDLSAPKALFPTYIPPLKTCDAAKAVVPQFLHVFPFDSQKIIFPKAEQKIQIEPEMAIVYDAKWQDGRLVALEPRFFGASNDVSIRKDGDVKISVKKNWGVFSKGFSDNAIKVQDGIFEQYRIASYLLRDGCLFEYGENSPATGYSYFGKKLNDWLLEKFNFQNDAGPCEDVHSYLKAAGFPKKIFVSIGATRYTDFGVSNFLKAGDYSVVVLYPSSYSKQKIEQFILNEKDINDSSVSILRQKVVVE